MQYRRLHFALLLILSWVFSLAGVAQTATYHLHKEASALTATDDKLLTAGPDGASVALTTVLTSKAAGEYLIKEFETQTGDPNTAGVIPSGSTLTFNVFMRKTANTGTVFPRAKIRLNNATGTLFCTATGTTALSTTVAKQAISCTTTANIAMAATDRFYLWVGVNLTATSSTAFSGELDIEGTLNGNFDSNVVLPLGSPAPTITSLTPNTGAVATSVVIAGTNFRTPQGSSTVSFNGVNSTPTAWSATSITAPVPTGATTGPVVVTVGGQASNGSTFTVTPAPSISSLAPNTGAVGSVVTISGSNFGQTQGNGGVKFGTLAATITSWSPTSIVATVPTGAVTGSVVVTAAGGVASNGSTFTVTAAPAITSVTPAAGGGFGSSFTITGTNFGATQGNGGITLNSVPATVSSWSTTSIVALVPSGVTTGNVIVTAAGGISSNGVRFKVLNPGGVAIDQTVFVDGTKAATTLATAAFSTSSTNELLLAFISSGKGTAATTTVNSVTGGSLTWVLVQRTNTQLGTSEIWRAFASTALTNATVTATLSQTVQSSMTVVSFTGVDTTGTNGSGAIGATATANAASGAPSATLTTTRANSVVFGVGDDPTAKVARTLGTSQSLVHQLLCSVSGQTCTLWVQQVPTLVSATGTLVTINDTAPTADAFNLSLVEVKQPAVAPTITSLTPASGPIGTPVTIAGTGFGATQGTSTVTFGGISATPTSWSNTSIVVPVPNGVALGAIPVVVSVPGAGTSNSATFTVVSPLAVSPILSPAPNANGWNNTNVTVSYVCSGGVPPVQCPGPQTVTTEGANQVVSATATDANGNHASASVSLNIDKTNPTISASVTPAAINGVVTLPAVVSFTCSDALSGTASCPASINVTTTGANERFNGTATDKAGNSSSTSITFSVQQTALSVSASAAPAANAAGWNNTNVTISYTCAGGVPPVQCPATNTVTLEGANQTISGTVTDAAAQTASTSISINLDKTPPTVSASVSPAPDANGIVRAISATVTFTCSDSLSGVAICPLPITVTTAGLQTFSGNATDIAGNTATASTQFNLQPFPPLQVVASVAPAPNAAGWNNTPVTVSFVCTGGAPPVSCPGPQTVSTDGANQVITGTATDGSAQSASASITLNIDQTPPAITSTIAPTPSSIGVVNANSATLTFNCSDSVSGIATCAPPITVTTKGLQTFNGIATDNAGNTGSTSVQIDLEPFQALSITASVSPLPNAAGWNNKPVTVTFLCAGGLPPVSCPASRTVSSDGAGQVIVGTATDGAGATAVVSATINLDQTPPLVSITSPADGSVSPVTNIAVAGAASDALSGVATVTCNGSPATVSAAGFTCSAQITQGSLAISVQATDNAGNSSTASVTTNMQGPKLAITSPAQLDLFNTRSITVTGTVDDSLASISVNGVPVPNNAGTFTAQNVILREGSNVVTAAATNAGGAQGTASVTVVIDTTPPIVVIDSPSDGAVLTSPSVYVTGMVNDVVPGTVNTAQMSVSVNGAVANVANRSFMAEDIQLVPGKNIITAVATDRAGNTSRSQISVTLLDASAQQRILQVSGNAQTGPAGVTLPQPLVVQVINGVGQTLSGVPITFTVNKSDGQLNTFPQQGRQITVQTDANGQASATFTLGTRVGNGNNQVLVTSPGFAGEVMFCETSTVGSPAQIHAIAGESQKGVVGQLLPQPFVVVVFDAGGNPVSGVPVIFNVDQGGGNLEGNQTVTKATDSDGRASVVLTLAQQEGLNNNVVSASFVGLTTSPISFIASGLAVGSATNTTVTGIVLDNGNKPITNVTASIEGTNLQALTDSNGRFTIANAPVGSVTLFIDGSSSTDGDPYPFLEFPLVTVAGQDNHLPGPVFLPELDTDNSKVVGGDEDVTLTMKGVPGVLFTVFAHSATFPDGAKVGKMSVSQVHSDKVPMPPPNATAPRLFWTVQPPRVKFDPPMRIQIPNTDGLAPGTVTEIFCYNHDLEEFASGGTARVSEDGSVVVSDPGSGVIVSGWGDAPPPPPPHGGAGGDQCPPPDSTGVTVKAQADGKDSKDVQFVDKAVAFTASVATGSCSNPTWNWDFGDGNTATSADGSASHAYHDPKHYTANVSVTCASTKCVSGTSANGSTDVTAFKIRVKELTFHNNQDIQKNDASGLYTNPLWVAGADDGSTPAQENPVMYTRNTLMNLDAKLSMTPALSDPVNITLEGSAPDSIGFSQDATISGSEFTVSAIDADSELGDSVKVYAPMQIQWKVTLSDTGSSSDINASNNAVYVTWADSLGMGGLNLGTAFTQPFLTVVHVGTTAAAGSSGSSDQTVIDAIWGKFSARNVHQAAANGADGAQMTYWRLAATGEPPQCQLLAGLVSSLADGTCIAWSSLLHNTWRAQGIDGSQIFEIRSNQSVNHGADGFLVKNWAFGKHIRTGPTGIRKSVLSGDDHALFDVGKGLPNSVCVIQSPDGLHTTPAGDDIPDASGAIRFINSGADGICNSKAVAADVQTTAVGTTTPDVTTVCVTGGADGLHTTPSGDDVVSGTTIVAGANKTCNTTAVRGDTQAIPVGQGQPDTFVIGPGPNGVLDSTVTPPDKQGDGEFTGQLYPYLMVDVDPIGDASPQTRIPAQGNDASPNSFNNHFVVKLGGKIYDPSYGAGPFDSELAHENAAADGITSCGRDGNTDTGAQCDNMGPDAAFAKKKNTAVQELKYIPH